MNIHLDRYKSQILNEAWFPAGGPEDTAHLNPELDAYGICERIADELGDETLDQLRQFISEADGTQLLQFTHDLLEVINNEHSYRYHNFDADEEAEDPKNKSSDVLPRQNKAARNLMRVHKMDPGSALDTAKGLVKSRPQKGPYSRFGTRGYFSN
jgi:hypothetical protein